MYYQFIKVDKNIKTIRSLNNACELGNVDEVKVIIRSNILSKYHINTMYYACKGGNIEIIKLIHKVCNRTNNGREMVDIWNSGLEGACEGGQVNIINMYKHNIHKLDSNFMCNCFKNACMSGNIECINYIIGMDDHNSYGIWRVGLLGACQGGHIGAIELTLNKGRFIDGSEWYIGILEACKRGHIEAVEYMLSRYTLSKILNDMLVSACSVGNMQMVEFIISKSATDLEYCPNTCLKYVCREGHMQMVQYLISEGATDWNGGLVASCYGGHLEIAKLMITKGATEFSEGLGHLCDNLDNCVEDNIQIAKIILSKNIEDLKDLSLGFYSACRGGCVEIAELVFEKYQNANGAGGGVINTKIGLMRACENESIEVLEFLVHKEVTNPFICLEMSCMVGNLKPLQFFMKYYTDVLNPDIISKLLTINKYHSYNPDIHVLLLNKCSDSDVYANNIYCDGCPTTNFKLYCMYANRNKIALSPKRYKVLLKVYPPYVLFIGGKTKNEKCHINRLPVELFRLLFEY